MLRTETIYYFNFWEMMYHSSTSPNENMVRIEELGFGYSTGDVLPIASNPELTSLYKWGVSRQLVTADNSLINAVLNLLQDENPVVYWSDHETLTDAEKAVANSKFYGWIRKTFPLYEMRQSLLNKTAAELLADVKTKITMERKTDTDTGKDVSATSDMPVTETFSDALASPATLADKISELIIAQRDYSHKWKDQTDTEDPRMTLPARIQEAIDTWYDVIQEWADDFMAQFSIAREEAL